MNSPPATDDSGPESLKWLREFARFASPVALITALLFYFGWVRTRFQANALGYGPAILDFALQDYLLKSVNVLFLPVALLLSAGLLFHRLDRRLIILAGSRPRLAAALSRTGRYLCLFSPLWIAVAVLLVADPRTRFLALPSCLTAATLLALYGYHLQRSLGGADRWTGTTTILVLLLLAFALFWDTERLARVSGEAFAADIVAAPEQLVAVTVYSQKRLELDDRVATEAALSRDSAYQFRYTGLRLLERTGDRYILLAQDADRILVLRDGEGLRFEFSAT